MQIQLTEADKAYLARIRRTIHAKPELAFEEYETSALIQAELAASGIEVQTGFAGTGVVGILRGAADGPVIGLRADMDALPVAEQTGAAFSSTRAGVMHACGHDAHTAMLLTAARILARQRADWHGTVKFIFQPAEEMRAGGKKLIADGALRDPDIDCVYGFHVWPDLPAGVIGLRHGALMASMDAFEVVLTGIGGHGAAPHQGIDAMVGGAHLITALQSIAGRETDPLDAVVVSVGEMSAGRGSNIIAEQARILGNIRTVRPQTRRQVLAAFERIVGGVAAAFRLRHEIRYTADYPVTFNHDSHVDFARTAFQTAFGAESVRLLEQPSMASEDFAYYLEQVPGAFMFLGVGDGAGGSYKLHHECFLPSETALYHGVAAYLALVANGAAQAA
ncbi:M20 family metallopeptidase [Neisseria leonii]|uniref:M20 family metallopeptidase n=1 Tax=Neisseria leonii TaxID=2995413 RepID=A0A9X4E264_9NEIS|nr:M20 family metallopeptidase [Neisseria sp. 51.81]MDD9328192.1 M20 family metallopeptidase [Neisseria sp. 51.81]